MTQTRRLFVHAMLCFLSAGQLSGNARRARCPRRRIRAWTSRCTSSRRTACAQSTSTLSRACPIWCPWCARAPGGGSTPMCAYVVYPRALGAPARLAVAQACPNVLMSCSSLRARCCGMVPARQQLCHMYVGYMASRRLPLPVMLRECAAWWPACEWQVLSGGVDSQQGHSHLHVALA